MLPHPRDILLAAVLLTRLPLPRLPDAAFADQARAVWAYPIVGVVVGGLGAIVLWATAGLGAEIAAGLALATMVIATGAMHEDGLADSADGLWGGQSRERRLAIMKDSQIGTYGVLALILAMGLRWSGLSQVSPTDLIAAAALSRAWMPVLMTALPHARDTGLSHSVGRPNTAMAVLGLCVGIGIAGLMLGLASMAAALAASACVAVITGGIARLKIEGQTGDILGGVQVLTEITILLTLVAVLA